MPKPKAARANKGKPNLSQLFFFALDELEKHCDAGRLKYPDAEDPENPGEFIPNWMLGGKPDEEYLDSMLRHMSHIKQRGIIDPETGTFHAAAIAWNALALITLNYRPSADYQPTDCRACPHAFAEGCGLNSEVTPNANSIPSGCPIYEGTGPNEAASPPPPAE